MKNNKGFTLMELIVAISIISVLGMIMVPALTKYVINAQKGVCESNREEFMYSFRTFKATDEAGLTLEQAINGDIPELAGTVEGLKCPSGGEFTVVDGAIHCSVHDGEGESEGGGAPGAGDTILGSVALLDWTAACNQALNAGQYESGTTLSSTTGQVYYYDSKYYMVKWDNPWLTKSDASSHLTNPSGVYFLQEFDPNVTITSSNYNSSTGWDPNLKHLDVLYENGTAYLYMGSTTKWEVLPQYGGYWIKLA